MKVRRFREIELIEKIDADVLKMTLFSIGENQDELNQSSLTIPRKSFEKAKSDIEAEMTQYQVDKNGIR